MNRQSKIYNGIGIACLIIIGVIFVINNGAMRQLDNEDKPVISNFSISPQKPVSGNMVTIEVDIQDEKGIKKVMAEIFHEAGSDKTEMSLISGDINNGRWQGKWVAHDITVKEYDIIILAYSNSGLSASETFKYLDPGWLSGWDYRKEITIEEQGGGTYDGYPTIIDVTFISGKMQSDFADIRFTESDGDTLIAHGLISKVDDDSAKFVLVRDYTALCTLTIYMYYGNPEASSAAVDYTTWVDNWYYNNGFGGGDTYYTNTVCSEYPYTKEGDIPSWAGDIYYVDGIVIDTYSSRYWSYYGRSKINGYGCAWASTSVCNGLATFSKDIYNYRSKNDQSYNNAAWVRGDHNVVVYGHYHGGYDNIYVTWLPVLPNIDWGNEETMSYYIPRPPSISPSGGGFMIF